MIMKNYIHLRNSIYYFRARFPHHLVKLIGRKELLRSLRTDSRQEAMKKCLPVMLEFNNTIEEAERRLAAIEATKPRELTQGEVMGFVSDWYQAALRTHQEDARPKSYDSDSVQQHKERLESAERSLRLKQEVHLAQNQYGMVAPIARRILNKAGIEVDTSGDSFGFLCQTLLRAWVHIEETTVARLKGNFNFQSSDNIMELLEQSSGQTSGAIKSKTLSELIEAYTEEFGLTWAKSTVSSKKTVFKFLKAALGEDRMLNELDREVGHEVFDKLKRLPQNWAKRRELRGLSLDKCITKAEKLGYPTLKIKTINATYMGFTNHMFDWAVTDQWITLNSFSGLKVRQTRKEKAKARENKKGSFSLSHLQKLFITSPWQSRDEYHEGNPSLFWGPLIALYHGFRVGEVSGLLVADIVPDDEDNGLAFRLIEHFDDNEEERTLKTGNATRVIPVHPELIKMGFSRFVNEQRKAGHRLLFPESRVDSNGKWGRLLTSWFNKHSRSIEAEPSGCTFHSFRHGFQDALRGIGLHGTAEGQALAGRKTDYRAANPNADTVSDDYGTRFKTSNLKPLIAKIQYQGLDLSHLYID